MVQHIHLYVYVCMYVLAAVCEPHLCMYACMHARSTCCFPPNFPEGNIHAYMLVCMYVCMFVGLSKVYTSLVLQTD
jgi:hypothetical protein